VERVGVEFSLEDEGESEKDCLIKGSRKAFGWSLGFKRLSDTRITITIPMRPMNP
jgi:hypothetical protein